MLSGCNLNLMKPSQGISKISDRTLQAGRIRVFTVAFKALLTDELAISTFVGYTLNSGYIEFLDEIRLFLASQRLIGKIRAKVQKYSEEAYRCINC